MLALTDHDETAGIAEAQEAAAAHGIYLVPGVEISVTWRGKTLHIVGLHIDILNPTLQAGLVSVRRGRRARAEGMAADLARVGITGSLEGAFRHARNPELIGRTHFARYLVERGLACAPSEVFRRYLSEGRPGFVPHQWATLEDAVSWIRASGGQAVIAHPGRYNLSREKFAEMVGEFRDLGGVGIEVIAPSHRPDQFETLAKISRAFGLKVSAGSDFHGPTQQSDLGRLPPLPCGVTPIWEGWSTGGTAH